MIVQENEFIQGILVDRREIFSQRRHSSIGALFC